MDSGPLIAIDLLGLANDLPHEYRSLRSLIERLSSAHSIQVDLLVASNMMRSLKTAQWQAYRAIASGAQEVWQVDAALALLNSAIVLYARATKSSSHHRGAVPFLKHFGDEEKAAHEHLCKLRDDAIAHFGPGLTSTGRSWHTEGVFVPLDDPDDLKVMTASQRLSKDRDEQLVVKSQIDVALSVARQVTKERNSEVEIEIRRLIEEPSFHDLARAHYYDLAQFYGSREEAEQVLAGRSGTNTAGPLHQAAE